MNTVGNAPAGNRNATPFRIFWEQYDALILGTIGTLTVLGIWQFLGTSGVVNPRFISSPTQVGMKWMEMVASGVLLRDLKVTLYEFVISLSIASAIAIPLGVLMGWYRRVEYLCEPFVWFMYATPKLALIPLLILWLGLGMPLIIFLATLLAIFPICINTWQGVQHVDSALIRAAKSFGASDWHMFTKVVLPGSIPFVAAGLRLGVGRALIGVVVGELFGGQAGLGFRIQYTSAFYRTSETMAALMMVIFLGVTTGLILKKLEGHTARWR